MKTITTTDTLVDVFENHYRPARLAASRSRTTFKKWHSSLRWFGEALGRAATVADLTDDAIDSAERFLDDRGISDISRAHFRGHMMTLWIFLGELKVIADAPKKRPPGRDRKKEFPTPTISHREWRGSDDWTGFPAKAFPGVNERRKIRGKLVTVAHPAESMTPSDRLSDLANCYIGRKLRGGNYASAQRYHATIDETEFLLDRPALISDLTNETIEAVAWQVKENGRAANTANGYRKALVALANFAFKCGILKTAPDVPKLVVPRKAPIGWTRKQLAILWDACKRQTGTIGPVPAADWLVALHNVLWDTGERITGALSARWQRLDSESRFLTIEAQYRKGKTEDLTKRLSPATMVSLEKIRLPERELIFEMHFSYSALIWRYKRMLKSCGLPHTREYKFHAIRRTSSSFLKVAGGNPTDFLLHSDPSVTRAYMVPEIVDIIQPSDILFRPDELPGSVKRIGVDEREAS